MQQIGSGCYKGCTNNSANGLLLTLHLIHITFSPILILIDNLKFLGAAPYVLPHDVANT